MREGGLVLDKLVLDVMSGFRWTSPRKVTAMKMLSALVLAISLSSCSVLRTNPTAEPARKSVNTIQTLSQKPTGRKSDDEHDLSRFSGEYSHNFSCTDEGAIVTVEFTRRTHRDTGFGEWRADGRMVDPNGQREVDFKSAHVEANDDGSVSVRTQFVDFKIEGSELIWLPAYDQNLTKQ